MFMDNEYSGKGEFNAVTASFSLEYYLSIWTQINLGVVGVLDDKSDTENWESFLSELGYKSWNETNNPAYQLFLGANSD